MGKGLHKLCFFPDHKYGESCGTVSSIGLFSHVKWLASCLDSDIWVKLVPVIVSKKHPFYYWGQSPANVPGTSVGATGFSGSSIESWRQDPSQDLSPCSCMSARGCVSLQAVSCALFHILKGMSFCLVRKGWYRVAIKVLFNEYRADSAFSNAILLSLGLKPFCLFYQDSTLSLHLFQKSSLW